MQLAVWQVSDEGPIRVPAGRVGLETELEDWIERDPSLAVEGLTVVGRQIILEGGRLDLLGVDTQARWTVVEIKRGHLYRDTVAQALDYASSVSTMPADRLRDIIGEELSAQSPVAEALDGEEGQRRDVRVVVVGTGRDSSLDRIVHFLGEGHDVPIQVVTFEVFAIEPEGQILVREVTEAERPVDSTTAAAAYKIEAVLAIANKHGTLDAFQAIYDFAQNQPLYARPWRWSIMFTPASARNRALFTVWTKPNGELRIYVAPGSTFSEFFPVSEERASEVLGPDEWHVVRGRQEAEALMNRIRPLLAAPAEGA